jgi:LPS-assembly protein
MNPEFDQERHIWRLREQCRWAAASLPLLCLMLGTSASAEEGVLDLKPSLEMVPRLSEQALGDAPMFVGGQLVEGSAGQNVTIQGAATLRRHDVVIDADRLDFDQTTSQARARGNVLLNRMGDRFVGEELTYNTETNSGVFLKPQFTLLANEVKGDASKVEFANQVQTTAHDMRYSTCPRPPGEHWLPDWMMRSKRVELDQVEEVGEAYNAVLEFKGVPLLASPYLTFPLSSKRKSGVLPPNFNVDNINGVEVTLPWYWNIAPNHDATFYPTVMAKRGIDYGAEYRYLTPGSDGLVRGAFMPSDSLRNNEDRWALSYQHAHRLPLERALASVGLGGEARLRWNLNRVSDDNYWRDFPRSTTSLTTRLLNNEAEASWAGGPWQFSALASQWQTLQVPEAVISKPFNRLPSLALRYNPTALGWVGLGDWKLSAQAEWTQFERNTLEGPVDLNNGARSVLVSQLARDWTAPGWFIKPKFQWHASHYALNVPNDKGQRAYSKSIPTISADTGLIFERGFDWLGQAQLQTLEPRLFWTWTPFEVQTNPIYDTAFKEFNTATLFSENLWGGHDRLSDTRAVTAGLTSRWLRAADGGEWARAGVAQRLALADCVGELGCPQAETEVRSDILVDGNVRLTDRWAADFTAQLDNQAQFARRTVTSLRYSPTNYRTISVGLRTQKAAPEAAQTEFVDVGWQWPVSDLWGVDAQDQGLGRGLGVGRWYSVAKINYSVANKDVTDLVAGFEYDGGCWVGRFVTSQIQRGSEQKNIRYMFQLEFVGFSRLGVSPLQTLRESIPRYQFLREQVNPPSRFQQYD